MSATEAAIDAQLQRAAVLFAAARADGRSATDARGMACKDVRYDLADALGSRSVETINAANVAICDHLADAYATAVAEDERERLRALAAPDELAPYLGLARVLEARAAVDAMRTAGYIADADAALSALRGRVLLAVAYAGDLTVARSLALAVEGVR